jgi:hypothetical protein
MYFPLLKSLISLKLVFLSLKPDITGTVYTSIPTQIHLYEQFKTHFTFLEHLDSDKHERPLSAASAKFSVKSYETGESIKSEYILE